MAVVTVLAAVDSAKTRAAVVVAALRRVVETVVVDIITNEVHLLRVTVAVAFVATVLRPVAVIDIVVHGVVVAPVSRVTTVEIEIRLMAGTLIMVRHRLSVGVGDLTEVIATLDAGVALGR